MGTRVVAIDSPSSWAANGDLSRECERDFVRTGLCGIRFTPDEATAAARTDRYLEWIELGLELWVAARAAGLHPIECFPTASWSAWLGPRGSRRRAPWTRNGIADLAEAGVAGLELARNQDDRDSVAAAFTARQWEAAPSSVDRFGDLVVPKPSSLDAALLP
jgi:predicted nuclease with RNAse H fold